MDDPRLSLFASRRRSDSTPEAPKPAPCLLDQVEVVATIGPDFQLLWSRADFARGLKVGDRLMAFVRPAIQNEQQPTGEINE